MEVSEPVNGTGASGPNPAPLLHAGELACGADVDLLLEQAADGYGRIRTAHQRGCVHCQAALAEFTALWEPVRELAAAPVRTPPDLSAAVLSQIRGIIRDVWFTLQVTGEGAVRIAARIVAKLARDSARRVPGVRVALGRTSYGRIAALVEAATYNHRHPHSAVGVLGRTAAVDLALAVTYGDPVRDIAREVQQQVAASLRENLGLKSVTVNVNVDDILEAGSGTPPRGRQARG